MKKWKRFFGVISMMVFSSSVWAAFEKGSGEFSGGEHLAMARGVYLKLPGSVEDAALFKFSLQNGLHLTYGEIIAMGDFYGTPDHPIVSTLPVSERRGLFTSAYHHLSADSKAETEVKALLLVMQSEVKAFEEGMQNGEKPSDIFRRIVEESDRQYNCITGGGCTGAWWMQKGRYLQIAASNDDHFNREATEAYLVGHQIAIEKALAARANQDVDQLKEAYVMNAFASHFLADSFSSGHIRTPRAQLRLLVEPSVIGSLLAHYMHDEENQNGLHVHNARGNRWFTLGDGGYFNDENAENRALIREALQVSADEIYQAYESGEVSLSGVLNLIPIADTTLHQVGKDISPLFYFDQASSQLLRRSDLENVYDFHWTDSWWGWSTVAMLSAERGMPTYAKEVMDAPGFQAALKH